MRIDSTPPPQNNFSNDPAPTQADVLAAQKNLQDAIKTNDPAQIKAALDKIEALLTNLAQPNAKEMADMQVISNLDAIYEEGPTSPNAKEYLDGINNALTDIANQLGGSNNSKSNLYRQQ